MPRARTKKQLLNFAEQEYHSLTTLLSTVSEAELQSILVFDNRNIKDLIAHLLAWHRLFLTWYTQGMNGETPKIPADGYSFKDTPLLNEKLYQEYKDISWKIMYTDFKATHTQILDLISKHSNEELTEKGHYSWTGSTNLCSYFASATASHYVWAIKEIKRALRK